MTAVVAEIPTASAALAFAEQAGKLPSLDSLFAMLEGAGISIGIEGRLRVFILLSRLSSLGVQLDDRADLLAHLLPVLAGSAQEQDEILRLVDKWIASKDERDRDPAAASQSIVPNQVEQLERVDRGSRWVVIGAASAIVLLLLGIAATKFYGGASPTQVATDVAGASHPVVSIGFGVNSYWKPVIEDGLSRLAFAAAVLIAGLSFGAWRREAKGRLVRQVGDTDLVSRFRLLVKAPRWFRTIDARTAFDRLKRVRWRDTDNIDAEQTILKTIRGGGRPTIEYKRLRELPNYVLLIDRSAQDDYAGLFARAIEGALIDARIVYSRYDFFGVLDRLNPIRGGAEKDIVDAEYLPFSVVASRHAGERLILIGAGTEFFEIPGIRVDRSGRRSVIRPWTPLAGLLHIREFSSASLITSAPVSAWGENERQLTELGFAIFPAEVKGIEDLATRIIAGPEAEESPLVKSALPGQDYILKRLDRYSQRFMSEVPPHRDEIDRVIGFLKAWAGPRDLYTLLAAIAAFPKIDPEFTFVLAKLILTSNGGEIDSALFGRLIRLPWIRDGYMPDWLRIAIINGLQENERDVIRRVQASMMKHVETGQDEPPGLDELVATFEVARQLTHGKLNELTARIMGKTGVLAADERIFFSVLNEEALDPIDDVIRPEAPEIVADRMDRPERRRRFWMRAMVLSVAVLAAWTQPWLWRVLTDGFDSAQSALKLPEIRNARVFLQLASASMSVSIFQWLLEVLRREPPASAPIPDSSRRRNWGALRSLPLRLSVNPRFTAFYACVLACADLLDPIFIIAAASLLAWVCIVAPKRWWNAQSADTMLLVQLQRNVITGSLGTLAVVTVWAIPWFHGALPVLSNTKSSIGQLFLAAMIGAAGFAASNALARRWLIGKPYTFSLDRCWLDLGFGLLTAFLMAAFVRSVGYFNAPDWIGGCAVQLSLAAYYLAMRSTTGAGSNSLVWRLALNAMLAAAVLVTLVGLPLVDFIAKLSPIRNDEVIRDIISITVVDIICASAVVVFIGLAVLVLRRRLQAAAIEPPPYPIKQTLLTGALCVMTGFGYTALLAANKQEVGKFVRFVSRLFGEGDIPDLSVHAWLFLPPLTAVFWPMFRILGLAVEQAVEPSKTASVPWGRAVAASPWWAVPAMWLAAIGWHFGDAAFSVWPLALPIAMVFAWKNGASATAAIAVGTLPLVLRIGDGDNIYWTPGGVWPALVVMFWARFVNDESFRQRLLRRESLPWLEAFVLVLLLAVKADFALPPNGMEKVAIYLDPSWMLATVAIIVGASRMPLHRLAIALVSVSPFAILSMVDHDGHGGTRIAGYDIFGTLMLLYVARAWRRYAAIGAGVSPRDPVTGLVDRRIANSRNSGANVASAAILAVGVLATGWTPVIDLGGIFPDSYLALAPAAFGALALTTIAGLVGGNLWLDRGGVVPKPIALVFQPLFLGCLLFAEYLLFAWGSQYGLKIFRFGARREDLIPSDLNAIGFAVCCVAFLALGLAIRVVAERRLEESWRDTVRRLWSAPRGPDKPTETPDLGTPDRDEDFKRAVA